MNNTSDVFEVGERVRVISYGPFRGSCTLSMMQNS